MTASSVLSGKTEPGLQTFRFFFPLLTRNRFFFILHKKTLELFFFILFAVEYSIQATTSDISAQSSNGIIKSINIHGNKVTKTETIKLIFGVNEGDLYDSIKVNFGELCLESTNLFSKTDVFTLFKEDGPHIYIMVTEKFYLLPSDIGGELYNRKYGKREVWWRLQLGVEHINFRGKMERLRTSLSFWDARGAALTWYKPLLPSSWYIRTGASVNYYPDLNQNSNNIRASSILSVGRKTFKNSSISLGMQPSFTRETFQYKKAFETDSETVFIDTFKAYELYSDIAWLSDFRNSSYDPSRGWYLYTRIKSNHLYSGFNNAYLQFNTNFRLYHRGFFSKDKFAYRMGAVLRNNEAGRLYWFYYGDAGTVRGYSRSTLGYRSNNGILLGIEYKFPIYSFPPLRLQFLNAISEALAEIRYHVDGALIFDYGRLSGNLKDLFDLSGKKTESGTGVGLGLRIIAPDFTRSVCFDLVWGKHLNTKWNDLKFYTPVMHFYLDMFY